MTELFSNSLRNKQCPCCLSTNFHKLGNIEYENSSLFSTVQITFKYQPELWRCKECGSTFVQNILPENTAVILYKEGDASNRWSKPGFVENKHKGIINILLANLYKGARVLDIGCNTGEFLTFAKDKGCSTFGVEYSKASQLILEKKGHYVFSSINECPDNSFDVITAFDLVEHMYDLRKFMTQCRRLLRVGGRMCILTGNCNSLSARLSGPKWWYASYPEHIVFPSKKYFKKYTEFRVKRLLYTYASRGYESPVIDTIKTATRHLLKNKYRGLPSIGPDHIFIVLENE